MTTVDCLVIGAGVIGLAAARAIAQQGYEVVIAERERAFGTAISARNSGVIHAGLYYPPDSLKTRLCIEGRPLLYEFCRDQGIAHARCGKLVVAASDWEVTQLEILRTRAEENGVEGLEIVDRAFIARREPAIKGLAALFSPATGIVEAEGLVRALLQSARAAGAIFLPGTPIIGGEPTADDNLVRTEHETI